MNQQQKERNSIMTHQEKAMRHAEAIKHLKTPELKREYAHVLCQYLVALLRQGK